MIIIIVIFRKIKIITHEWSVRSTLVAQNNYDMIHNDFKMKIFYSSLYHHGHLKNYTDFPHLRFVPPSLLEPANVLSKRHHFCTPAVFVA